MKLKKITAYQQIDGPSGEVITIIPSGFPMVWICVSEDIAYNVGAGYPTSSKAIQEIIDGVKEAT